MVGSIGILSFDDAFAEHVQYKTRDEMEKIDVKLFFVTSFDECSRNNWNAIEGYSAITKSYLWKYNIVATTSIDCINQDRLSYAVDSSLSSYDLTIIFPDIWKSFEWLYAKGIGGHYMYPGNDKTIVTETLTFDADSADSVWILSHELSHFALHWYGYPYDVRSGEVHTAQAEYDACMNRDPTGAYCRHLWELVESNVTADESRGIGAKYHVMEPLRSDRYVEPTYQNPSSSYSNTYVQEKPKDPSNFNKLLDTYEMVKEQMNYRISSKLDKYSSEIKYFESPLAKEKLNYVIQKLNKMNFGDSDRYVENFKESWNNGYYSDAEDLLNGEIDYWTQQQNPAIASLEAKYYEAKELENKYQTQIKLEKERKDALITKNDFDRNDISSKITQPAPVIPQQEHVQKIESTPKQKISCGPGTTITWTDNDGVVHTKKTVLKNGLCYADKIHSDEHKKDKFCFLFWCW